MTVRLSRPGRPRLSLHIPVLPLLLLVSPLLLLLALALAAACLAARAAPMGVLHGIGQLLRALPGSRVEVEQGRTAVLVSVSRVPGIP
ncbi:hypothetical protein ACIQ9E_25615 [Streptomyces sp. NPDC094448]|uniref:hypothetical protein n=1 Tax=Streptomyces sp. NPDC094448 TaxID=3366063 RepID=UPI0037F9C936